VDSVVHPASLSKEVEKAMKETAASKLDDEDAVIGELVAEHESLVDPIWGDDRQSQLLFFAYTLWNTRARLLAKS
jgi:hypothetical protein